MKFPFFNSKPKELKQDTYQNIATGLGLASRDKRLAASAVAQTKTITELRELWKADVIAARLVEVMAEEMVRGGWRIDSENLEANAAIEDLSDSMGIANTLRKAICYQRAFGGAAVLLGTDEGASSFEYLETPLELDRAKGLKFLHVFTPEECKAVTTGDSPMEATYGIPTMYSIEGLQGAVRTPKFLVHHSRLLIFKGADFGKYENSKYGWGQSILERCAEPLRDFSASHQAAALLIQEFAQKIYSQTDLAQMLGSGKRDQILQRLETLNYSLGLANMAVIDGTESITRLAVPSSGLPDLLSKVAERLAAAAQIPVTVLFGQTPSGMNATGATEMRLYYDRVAAAQNDYLRPALNKIYSILFKQLGFEVPKFKIKFNPLWQMSELEQADLRVKMAQADVAYVGAGVLSPEEVADSRFGSEFSLNTQIDLEARGATSEAQRIIEAPIDETQAP